MLVVVRLDVFGEDLGLKEPILGGDILELKARIERSMKLNPDVDDAFASVQLDRRGILTLQIRFSLTGSGQVVDVGVKSDPATGTLVEL